MCSVPPAGNNKIAAIPCREYEKKDERTADYCRSHKMEVCDEKNTPHFTASKRHGLMLKQKAKNSS